jgi:hypothetical protein
MTVRNEFHSAREILRDDIIIIHSLQLFLVGHNLARALSLSLSLLTRFLFKVVR